MFAAKVLALLYLGGQCVVAKPVASLLNNRERDTVIRAVDLDPYPGKPRVTFKEDGTFKITVFSDLHFGENPWDAWGPEQDVNSTRLMRTVLADEKPDYVCVFEALRGS